MKFWYAVQIEPPTGTDVTSKVKDLLSTGWEFFVEDGFLFICPADGESRKDKMRRFSGDIANVVKELTCGEELRSQR